MIHASGGAMIRIAMVTCQLVHSITPSIAITCRVCCSMTFIASIAAWATWSLSDPSRTSIDGTGSASKRSPGSRRYLPSTWTRRSRAMPRPDLAMWMSVM